MCAGVSDFYNLMFDVRLEAASTLGVSAWIPSASLPLDVGIYVWELMRQRVATRACVSHNLVLYSLITPHSWTDHV